MIKQIQWFFICMVVLSACTTLPKSADQSVYATYGFYITIANTTADLLDQGVISKEKAVNIQEELQQIRPPLNVAVELIKQGKPVPGDVLQTLQLSQAVLIEIQKELQKRAAP